MRKFMPFEQYDVLAIETWLNDIAAQGYKLTDFGAFFCKFEKNEGPRIYYRVRYIDGNKDIGDAFWWGDLYVYHAENPNDLPRPNYEEDAKVCASKQGKPRQMIVSVLAVAWLVKQAYDDMAFGLPWLTAASIVTIIMWLLNLLSDYLRWDRANRLAAGSLSVTVNPPKPYTKLFGSVAQGMAFVALALILANAYFNPSIIATFP